MSVFLPALLVAGLPWSAAAVVNASLSWTPSSDPTIAGYNIYYGTVSHQYTNSLSVGAVNSALISGLTENTTYFFAAKARNASGDESDFSNEAAFVGVTATPQGGLRLKTLSSLSGGDPLAFSLASGSPAGMTINATNGSLSWTPGHAYASTTNYINIVVTDTVNPALSVSETLVVIVADYLECQLGATAVYSGQPGSLPVIVNSSSSVTNMQITVNWPDTQLLNPTLSFVAPVTAGSLHVQNHQLTVQLQTSSGQALNGTQVAQINFQSAAGQPTATLGIAAAAASAKAVDGSAYGNVQAQGGEVTIVGAQSMLRSQLDSVAGRTVSLYANPGTYQLQYATSLAGAGNWQPLTTYQQTNAAQVVALNSTNSAIFYRLRQL